MLIKPKTQKPTKKETLVKKTTTYNNQKYLIIVDYLERKISKIMKEA